MASIGQEIQLRPRFVAGDEFTIDLTESARYVFDRRIGLNRAGTLERTATGGEDRRIERWEFSLTSPPKR